MENVADQKQNQSRKRSSKVRPRITKWGASRDNRQESMRHKIKTEVYYSASPIKGTNRRAK